MSKQTRKHGGNDHYKRGYANGVRAAVEALLDDLLDTGKLTVDYDEDGRSQVCIGCMLHGQEFHRLAGRLEFVRGVKHEPGQVQEGGADHA